LSGMPWYVFEMDEGLVGEYPTKKDALAEHEPIWKLRRITAGVYEFYRGYNARDHDGPWWLYGSRALARADGWEIEGTEAEVMPKRQRKTKRITLAEGRDEQDRVTVKVEAQRTTLVAGAGRVTVTCAWFDENGIPVREAVVWPSKFLAMALANAF
jgi:hypothetical protein